MQTAIKTNAWGDTYGVRADWAQASSQVQQLDADGKWVAIGKQVADFRHRGIDALRYVLERAAEDSGADLDSAETQDEIFRALECLESFA